MKAIAPLALLALTACQPGRPVVTLPPAELAHCADMPQAPELPERSDDAAQMVRDTLTLSYILALRSAYGSCRGNVDALRVWRERMGG